MGEQFSKGELPLTLTLSPEYRGEGTASHSAIKPS
jgi:hypothetical protein